uniref:Uncharacterized protein n=1 Tax=Arundo donax TaxID=35708 RepID=A0A0A9DS85_ARUDO
MLCANTCNPDVATFSTQLGSPRKSGTSASISISGFKAFNFCTVSAK